MASVPIVDDDSVVCDLLERFVRFAGYEAASVPDARSALEAMASSARNVVLCDVHLEDGPGGLWLADRIRELYPATAMILATGDVTVPPTESLRKGVVAYLVKPFRQADVALAVRNGVLWAKKESSKRMSRRP
jgi:DNA-binding NtrC family response regulator